MNNSKRQSTFKPLWKGLFEYQEALSFQLECVQKVLEHRNEHQNKIRNEKSKDSPEETKRKSQTGNYIIGLEHPSVITLGIRGNSKEDVFFPFNSSQIPVVQVDRGGQATLHSPGQLVIYPILDLKELSWSVKDFIQDLLLTTQDLFSHLGVKTNLQLNDQTGLYTENGKIAFCGLRVKNGISFHGISINIKNDLSLFQCIRSCGVREAQLTSLEKELGDNPELEVIFQMWFKLYKERINR